jgi:hypothetical protein
MKFSRGLCSECGRSVALDDRNRLWDHNRNAAGDGALFRGKRVLGTSGEAHYGPLCPGSGKLATPKP